MLLPVCLIVQYRQDHLTVVDDIVAGNVVWKPKNEWRQLEQAMAEAEMDKSCRESYQDAHSKWID